MLANLCAADTQYVSHMLYRHPQNMLFALQASLGFKEDCVLLGIDPATLQCHLLYCSTS